MVQSFSRAMLCTLTRNAKDVYCKKWDKCFDVRIQREVIKHWFPILKFKQDARSM